MRGECVCLFASVLALQWTGDLSGLYLASHLLATGIRSSFCSDFVLLLAFGLETAFGSKSNMVVKKFLYPFECQRFMNICLILLLLCRYASWSYFLVEDIAHIFHFAWNAHMGGFWYTVALCLSAHPQSVTQYMIDSDKTYIWCSMFCASVLTQVKKNA